MKKHSYFAHLGLAAFVFGLTGCAHVAKPSLKTTISVNASSVDPDSDSQSISVASEAALKNRDFKALSQMLDDARRARTRLPGGYWKSYAVYSGILKPNFERNATPREWEMHFARLSEWKTAFPDAIEPRVALAGSLVAAGFEARGTDFVDKISDESMRLFQSRVRQGEKELLDAKDLPKCPEWYSVMLKVGLAQSWPRKKYDEIFEEGFRLEPTYYHLSREKIVYLLPQWNGRPGDLNTFIQDVAERVGGDEGAIIYFELSSTLWAQYRDSMWSKTGLDWTRAKAGYFAMKQKYGLDPYRRNLFMAMATSSHGPIANVEDLADKYTEVLQEVGNEWDRDVFPTQDKFTERIQMIQTMLKVAKGQKPPSSGPISAQSTN